jgi:type IV pilus assembly protein PilA
MPQKRQEGFTLIELLVVILIIAILAAIAIPIFLQQRKRAYDAQVQSALKSAATAAESYATTTGGDFTGLDGDDGTILRADGYKSAEPVTISVAATANEYCVTATHSNLEATDPWQTATYNSDEGSPTPRDADTCP